MIFSDFLCTGIAKRNFFMSFAKRAKSVIVWHIFNSITCAPKEEDRTSTKSILKLIDIFSKAFLRHLKRFVWPKLLQKRLFKIQCDSETGPRLRHFSDKLKAKWLGAWLRWFFTIIIHLFTVFNFIFAKSSWKNICFCWRHTITRGTDLRRSPHVW